MENDRTNAAPKGAAEARDIEKRIENAAELLRKAQAEIATQVWGQDQIIRLTLACMVAGGHLLAEGVPGTGKTLLVAATSKVTGLATKRIQFTSDLMPADILGSDILTEGRREFVKGPVFTQFLLADEINRASPKTQSALLEAMQEKQVTVMGNSLALPKPFHVMATQNPQEQEGTNPLPEAQLDRFLMKVGVTYPDKEAARRILMDRSTTAEKMGALTEVFNAAQLQEMQELARKVVISQETQDAILHLVMNARPETNPDIRDMVVQGPGDRTLQAFARAASAMAMMDGRQATNVNDVKALITPVMEHRMILKYRVNFKDVIEKLTHTL